MLEPHGKSNAAAMRTPPTPTAAFFAAPPTAPALEQRVGQADERIALQVLGAKLLRDDPCQHPQALLSVSTSRHSKRQHQQAL